MRQDIGFSEAAPFGEERFEDMTTQQLEKDLALEVEQIENISDLSDDAQRELSQMVNELRERKDLSQEGRAQVNDIARILNPQEIHAEEDDEDGAPV